LGGNEGGEIDLGVGEAGAADAFVGAREALRGASFVEVVGGGDELLNGLVDRCAAEDEILGDSVAKSEKFGDGSGLGEEDVAIEVEGEVVIVNVE
jgi:hypothetical protein